MKKQKNLIIALSLVVGVVVGLVVGFVLTDPCRDLGDAAGTIGRVEHYRDVQISEADIDLRNQFLDDDGMLERYEMYLGYEYATNLKQAENTRFALLAGRQHNEFSAQNRQVLDRMEEYSRLMDNARLRILEALGVITDLENREGVAVRTVLNSAGNAIAQTQIRGNVLFDYLVAVEDFFDTHPQTEYPALTRAHDELYATLLMNNIIRDNKPVLDHLLAKNLLDEDGELAQMDIEQLQGSILFDAARLNARFLDQETLQSISIMDQELLNTGFMITDQEMLGLLDAEAMGAYTDHEALKLLIMDQEALDNLSGLFGDRETLQSLSIHDQETLRSNGDLMLDQTTLSAVMNQAALNWRMEIWDQDRLNLIFQDKAHLQDMVRSGEALQVFDSEQLRFLDSEQLRSGDLMFDTDMLNLYDFRVQ